MTLAQFLAVAAKIHGVELESSVLESMTRAAADWMHGTQAQLAIGQGMLVREGSIVRNVADSLGAAAKIRTAEIQVSPSE